MRHRATPRFWGCYASLPEDARRLSDRCFDALKKDLQHPSLHVKKVGRFRSVRVGLHHRALAVEQETGWVWFWIGTHAAYDKLIGRA